MAGSNALQTLMRVAADPRAYALEWKLRHPGRRVVGVLPMNFPVELVEAAGALPWLLQEGRVAITRGNAVFPPFYCGFTRSLVDQGECGQLAHLDALYFVDNCVQLIGAADVFRARHATLPVRYFQLDPSIKADSSTVGTARRVFGQLREELTVLTGAAVSDAAIKAGIRTANRQRALLRQLHARRLESGWPGASVMQALVTSAMVMERAEHVALLEEVAALTAPQDPRAGGAVRLHLSGHLCQAPKTELLDLIEDCGAIVVDDDLFHGRRFYATDVPEAQDPLEALVAWYLGRNATLPCPTRTHGSLHWDAWLLRNAGASRAEGVITLLVKFCEPHMYQVPELIEAMKGAGVPHLLLETEHEGMPLEAMRTRVESFVEGIVSRRGAGRHGEVLIRENA